MKIYELKRQQVLRLDLNEAWDFFSSPANLKKITPSYMGFDIVSETAGIKMYPGMIISYKVRPLLNLPLSWTTEITHVNEPFFFVDEQRFGPYRFWHHKHYFEEIKTTGNRKAVRCTDIVHYAVGYGIAGRILNTFVIRKRLDDIFNYRRKKLADFFGEAVNE